MSAAVHFGEVERVCETRRRRIYHADWKFRIGQSVRLDGVPGIILSRQRSARGRELYQVWLTRGSCGRPYRWVLGKALS